MYHSMKKIYLLILIFGMLLFSDRIFAEEQVITVGFCNEDDAYVKAASEENSYANIFFDRLFDEVDLNQEYRFEYVNGSRTYMEAALKHGTIDILIAEPQAYDWNGEARYTHEFESAQKLNARYSTEWIAIYVPEKSAVYYDDAKSLEDKVIGVTDRDYHRRLLNSYLDEKNLHMEIRVFANQAQMEIAFEEEQIDAMVCSTKQTSYRRISMYLGYGDKRIYVSESRTALGQMLNSAYNKVIQANQYFLHDLDKESYPQKSYLSFTREQIGYIMNSDVLTVVYPVNRPPEIYENSSGEMAGKFADYAKLIEENSKLSFEYIAKDSYLDCVEALKNGEADLILGAYNMKDSLKKNGFDASIPFTTIGLSIVGKYDVKLDDPLKVGIWEDISQIGADKKIEERFPNWKIFSFESDVETIEAISEGEIDVAIVSGDRVSTLLSRVESNIGSVFIMEADQGISLAYRDEEDSRMLGDVLNQAISRITPEETRLIETSQAAAIVRELSFREFLWSHRWGIFSAAVLGLVILSWYVLLRRNRRIKAEARYAAMSRQLEIQCQHYNVLKEYQDAIRTYRHDWNHHTLILSSCLERGDMEGLKNYLAEMSGALPTFSLVDTGNPILDAILSDRLERARGLGIQVESEIDIPPAMQMDAMDINSIFSNCLDNAIESCQRVMKKKYDHTFIHIKLKEKKGNLLFKMENSTLHVVRTDEGPMTWKSGSEHGLGLRSVKAAIDKYNGYFEEKDQAGVYCTTFTINHIWGD